MEGGGGAGRRNVRKEIIHRMMNIYMGRQSNLKSSLGEFYIETAKVQTHFVTKKQQSQVN